MSAARVSIDVRPGNPWGLSRRQAIVMEALCLSSSQETAAELLGRSVNYVSEHHADARIRMGVGRGHRAVLMWDRWHRGDGADD